MCVSVNASLCTSLSGWSTCFFFHEGESSRVTLKRAGSLATFSPSHCFSLSAGHVILSMLQYPCFGLLVLCFLSVFSTTHSPAFLWLSPSISCDISAPSHNKTPSAFSCSEYCALFPLHLCECLLMLVAVCSLLFTGCCSVITCSRSVDLCFMTMCAHGTER